MARHPPISIINIFVRGSSLVFCIVRFFCIYLSNKYSTLIPNLPINLTEKPDSSIIRIRVNLFYENMSQPQFL